jgi:lactate 2-monooxygenase
MVASTLSNDPLEEVASEFGETPGFFQLYTPTDRALAESLVRRAEAAGFKGIVVTLDTWVTGWRPRDLNQSNFPMLRGHALANYFSDSVFRGSLAEPPEKDLSAAIMQWGKIFGNPLNWDDLPWLRSLTKLPLIMKGICHPDDARRAIDVGVDGIYCSNHGGARPTAELRRWICCPASSKPPAIPPFCLIPGYAQERKSLRRWRSARPPLASAGRMLMDSRSTAWRVSFMYCDAFWLKRIC